MILYVKYSYNQLRFKVVIDNSCTGPLFAGHIITFAYETVFVVLLILQKLMTCNSP